MTSSLPDHIVPQKTSDAGTCLFTSKELSAGELIFRIERPLVSVLDTARLRDTCEACFLLLPENRGGGRDPDGRTVLKNCSGCRVVRYCCKVGFLASSLADLVTLECFGIDGGLIFVSYRTKIKH